MLAVALLLLAAALLAALGAATAVPPGQPLPDFDAFAAAWSGVHGNVDVHGSRWVHRWLRLTYRMARPLARRGVAPDLLTAWGVLLGVALLVAADAGGRWLVAAFGAALAAGIVDGLDGAVALLAGRATRWGSVLDSTVDRLGDLLQTLALLMLGGTAALAAAAAAALLLLEYLRARAAAAGMTGIGVVTVGERPSRVAVVAGGLLTAGLWPDLASTVARVALATVAVLSVVGFAQLIVVVRRTLAAVTPDRSDH